MFLKPLQKTAGNSKFCILNFPMQQWWKMLAKNLQLFCVTRQVLSFEGARIWAHAHREREVLMRSCCGCGVRQFACSLSRVLRKFNKVQSGGGAHARAYKKCKCRQLKKVIYSLRPREWWSPHSAFPLYAPGKYSMQKGSSAARWKSCSRKGQERERRRDKGK